MIDGLWRGPTALTQDFGTVAYRIQLLGFNAIRLPFSFQVWPLTSTFLCISADVGEMEPCAHACRFRGLIDSPNLLHQQKILQG